MLRHTFFAFSYLFDSFNGLHYLRVGVSRRARQPGVDNAWEQEKLEARKISKKAAESHTSGAPLHDGGHHISQKKQGGWTKYTAKMADEEAVH